MTSLAILPSGPLCGRMAVPGDKSISHRSVLLGALADGVSHVENFLTSGDCLASLDCARQLGIRIESQAPLSPGGQSANLVIHGKGLAGLQAPSGPLNCCRSGTTMRLLAGILAGQPFDCTLTGDPQLLRRPMRRVVEPLAQMGAAIDSSAGCAPLVIHGRQLHGLETQLPVASAQVKSCILLAGLYAGGPSRVSLPGPARDHTERILRSQMDNPENHLTYTADAFYLNPAGLDCLRPLNLTVPGDFSSAAFIMVAAVLTPGSRVVIERVGVNPTRTGLLDVLKMMGADIRLENLDQTSNEPVADLVICASELEGVEVGGDLVVRMIDEFPALAVAATQASGVTLVRDAAELRVKETDRIAVMVKELQALGAKVEGFADGFAIYGPTRLSGTPVDSSHDHRLAMALAVAGLIAGGETLVLDSACISDSYPGFEAALTGLGAKLVIL